MIYVEKPCVTLAACRVNAGKTETEWAEALGVKTASVKKWETNGPAPELPLLIKISELSRIPLGLISVPE